MFAASSLLALLAALPAAADPAIPLACPSPLELRDEVTGCETNAHAAERAEQCYERIVEEWKRRSAELGADLARLAKNADAQKRMVETAAGDYAKTVAGMDAGISALEQNGDRIAGYPDMLVRFFPGISDPHQPECLREPFERIRKVHERLQGEIRRAKGSRAEMAGLLHRTAEKAPSFEGTARKVRSGTGQGGVETKAGKSPGGSSTITGPVHEDERK